ncbi:MAG: PD-(D/E)XK nuclease family protein [Motiliproteus sp.]
MSVSITVGLGLDGTVASPHRASVGELLGGPSRLLQWLESQLGLELPQASFTQRVLQYLACLKQCDAAERFYHQSLSLDELGVARRLLEWRDIWYEAGWQGKPLVSTGQRLADMAEVEVLAVQAVAPNIGQRVQRVLLALEQSPLTVGVVTLDPVEAYPAVWQQLLRQLNAEFAAPHPVVRAEAGSDLAQLQSLLLAGVIPQDPQSLRGDGSVLLLAAPSHGVSAPWVAQYAKQLLTGVDDYQLGLLCDGSSEELDLALEQAGVAILASGENSPWRPVFQVLPLVMDLLWSPLNPSRLLEFLSHPVGPISRRVRQALAEVVASEPGIGGSLWRQTVDKVLDQERQRHSDVKLADKAVAKLRTAINFWLESERFSAYPGAPVSVVIKRASAVNSWLNGLINLVLEDEEKAAELALYRSALNQVLEFVRSVELLREQGGEAINADTLRRLIKAVRGNGASRPDRQAQLIQGQSKMCYGSDASAFVSPLQTSIWWACDEASLASRHHWTQLEQQALAANGVALLADEHAVAWQTQCWIRPLLAAQKQAVLVVHDSGDGHHPLFDQIHALVSGLTEYDLLAATQALQAIDLPAMPQAEAVAALLLPGKQRLWQLPAATTMPKRDRESFSSLESFLFGPYMWVLRYQAKLKAGALLSVKDDNLLKGSLAHQLYEDFFNAHNDIAVLRSPAVTKWAEAALAELIATTGAVLLMPGRSAEREHFISVTVTALNRLIVHLQSAQVVSVVMESHAEGLFVGGALGGYLDLLATKADGSEAVLDIKWGGARYRRESMAESRYLQLAIYAELRRQASQSFPVVGYFVIASQELMLLNSDYFPQAESIEADNGEDIAQFWYRFEKSWKQRREQLDHGLIEVNVSGTEVNESLVLGEECLASVDVYESFSEFGVLVGWEVDA